MRTLVLPMVALSLLLTGGGLQASTDGPWVTAVVVKSWGGCHSNNQIWDDLNAEWSNYGLIPIEIDYSDPALCGESFTYEALVANGADVVILSDPAGGNEQYFMSEIEALRRYAQDGHNVIGTYLTFSNPESGVDNRNLAPLFGLSRHIAYARDDQEIDAAYRLRADIALFRNLPNPYVSSGFAFTQLPDDGLWSSNELAGGTYVARTPGRRAVITLFRGPGFDGIYISNMPEYGGGEADKQFFYNAIIWPAEG